MLSKQKAEMEKRQQKIDRMAAKRARKVEEAEVEHEQELDALDRENARRQEQGKSFSEVSRVETGTQERMWSMHCRGKLLRRRLKWRQDCQ